MSNLPALETIDSKPSRFGTIAEAMSTFLAIEARLWASIGHMARLFAAKA